MKAVEFDLTKQEAEALEAFPGDRDELIIMACELFLQRGCRRSGGYRASSESRVCVKAVIPESLQMRLGRASVQDAVIEFLRSNKPFGTRQRPPEEPCTVMASILPKALRDQIEPASPFGRSSCRAENAAPLRSRTEWLMEMAKELPKPPAAA
jgi:hypothetical protein